MSKQREEKKVKVGEFIENPTKSQIEEYLAEIGWSIRHHGCEMYYVYNHKKKATDLMLIFPNTDSRLEISPGYPHNKPSCYWYMKDLRIEMLVIGI
jgi:hypothetical protein